MEPESLMINGVTREAEIVIDDLHDKSIKKLEEMSLDREKVYEVRVLEEALWRACNKIKKLQKELIN